MIMRLINRAVLLVIPLWLVAAGCSHKAAPPVVPPPEVATVTVAPQPVVLTTELSGRTAPYRIA